MISQIVLFSGFIIIVLCSMKMGAVIYDMKLKYNFKSWHTGYFADRKFMKLVSEEDRLYIKKINKKYSRIQLLTLVGIIIYCIVFGGILKIN